MRQVANWAARELLASERRALGVRRLPYKLAVSVFALGSGVWLMIDRDVVFGATATLVLATATALEAWYDCRRSS